MKNKSFAKHYYLMLLPGFIWLLLFSIVPMFGIAIAFQDYNPVQGVFGSEWVGLEHFEYM
ncbi:protein lplB, partial [Shouchella clausii]